MMFNPDTILVMAAAFIGVYLFLNVFNKTIMPWIAGIFKAFANPSIEGLVNIGIFLMLVYLAFS